MIENTGVAIVSTHLELMREKIAEIRTLIMRESKLHITEENRRKLDAIRFDISRLEQSIQQYEETIESP